ncbi:MAG: hypothetical protein KC478_13705, partial [Bacteriovoracaceae bacterium]|nr:hypothetical protein [Bacteriovoracaceae bacterium]
MKRFKKRVRVHFKLWMRHHSSASVAFVFLLVLTFSLAGVGYKYKSDSKGFVGTSTFAQWSAHHENKATRTLASSEQACEEAKLSAKSIDKEITQLEALYDSGHEVQGNWYGIDLASLPTIQAQLLADHGSLIGNKNHSQNYRQCTDVVCVFNSIYKDKTELSGKLVYYWYLKTGSMLNLSNMVPGQLSKYPGKYQKQTIKLSEYLFNLDELKKFHNLARALPSRFVHNPLFRSIHKIPNKLAIEQEDESTCSKAMVSGQILMGSKCLPEDQTQFSLKVSEHIAQYIDQYHAQKNGKLFSHSKQWLNSSQWEKEQVWDFSSDEFKQVWTSTLDEKHFLDKNSSLNPSKQFSSLLAAYRFRPNLVQAKTPIELRNLIKNEFFHGQSYDANGLYESYLSNTLSSWRKKESTIWKDCLDEHYNPSNKRELASSLENPLFTCVESKVPNFIQDSVLQLKQQETEGCGFFNNQDTFGHVSKRYQTNVDKFLTEQVLKRKLELKSHGDEVVTGLVAKESFLSEVDPGSLFINCFNKSNPSQCYEQNLLMGINKTLKKHNQLSTHYKEVIKKDIASLFPYSQVEKNTQILAKRFLAPFNSQINFAAQELWNNCRRRSSPERLDMSLFFAGGSKYVQASLLNCISEKAQEKLSKIVDQGSFHQVEDKRVSFKLNPAEKIFALTFMKSKMKQALNNILEEELKLEKHRLASYFKDKKRKIQKDLKESKTLLTDVYSYEQVNSACLKDVQKSYPKRVLYHSQRTLDKGPGRKICSSFIELPETKTIIEEKSQKSWENNLKLVEGHLDEFFSDKVSDCIESFPRTLGENFEK